MQYSIATVCIAGTFESKVKAIAEAGFTHLELFENDWVTYSGSPRQARQLLDEFGLNISVFQPFRDFECLPEPLRSNAFDRAERKFDLMGELGSDLLMICSSVHPQCLGGINRTADDLGELAERAEKCGIRIAFEALSWSPTLWDYRDAWEAVRRADHPALGLCLDTFHIFSRGCDLGQIRNIPGEKIFLVQVADAPNLQMDPLSWSRHHRCFPGQGQLDLSGFMDNLNNTGFDGPFSLEVFNDQFRSGHAQPTAADGYRSLVYLAGQQENKADLKPAHAPGAIEFIEFAASEQEQVQISSILTGLGFAKTGVHKSKRVERWQQGKINLVINQEPQSHAQQYHSEHGLSVCAYGLTQIEPEHVLARAAQLAYPESRGNPVKDTHGLGALTGPAGALLYLVNPEDANTHWEREFVEQTDRPAAYLNRVDHVAMSVDFEESLAASLFYRSALNLEATPSVNVLDPSGLVRSQVYENSDKSLCFTLNSTQASNTSQARIRENYAGSGVNHIAFSTTDIFATAEYLAAHGVSTMTVPTNYYDDLDARFLLGASEVGRLSQWNILYDEDEQGPFYQLYTHMLGGRFCFEIVQRNSYRGYGMANSQLRLTMQARELGLA